MILKKITYSIVSITCIFSLIKCSKELGSANEQEKETGYVSKQMAITAGSNSKVSAFSQAIGISNIEVSEGDSGKVDLRFKGKPTILNNYMVNFSNESFSIKTLKPDEEYSIIDKQKSSSFTFNVKNHQTFVTIGKRKFSLEDYSTIRLRNSEKFEFIKLFALAVEVFDKSQTRKSDPQWAQVLKTANRYDAKGKKLSANISETSCYRYNFNAGLTKSACENEAAKDAKTFLDAYKSCKQVGEVETTCLFSISPCASVTTFECTGGICNFRGYITE